MDNSSQRTEEATFSYKIDNVTKFKYDDRLLLIKFKAKGENCAPLKMEDGKRKRNT